MIVNGHQLILLAAALFLALMAGLFFNWSNTIMPGLSQLPDRDFIRNMQIFNRTIQNPLFLVVFLGTALLLPLATGWHYTVPGRQKFYWLLAASLVYLGGVMAVTVFGNIPLNNKLDRIDLSMADKTLVSSQRLQFETTWNRLNNIRTISAVISLLLLLIACCIHEKNHSDHTVL